MKIGVAGPIDMSLLRDLFSSCSTIPNTYSFAFTANLARAFYNRGHEIALFTLSREVASTRCISGDRITAYICPERRPRCQMLDFFRQERHGLRDAMRIRLRCDPRTLDVRVWIRRCREWSSSRRNCPGRSHCGLTVCPTSVLDRETAACLSRFTEGTMCYGCIPLYRCRPAIFCKASEGDCRNPERRDAGHI